MPCISHSLAWRKCSEYLMTHLGHQPATKMVLHIQKQQANCHSERSEESAFPNPYAPDDISLRATNTRNSKTTQGRHAETAQGHLMCEADTFCWHESCGECP